MFKNGIHIHGAGSRKVADQADIQKILLLALY